MPRRKPAAGDAAPARLGRYAITGRLGAGGMGVVYRADDPLLKRPVALKLLSDDVAASPEALKRFLREAQSAARLNHPNVVSVYDIGEADGKRFIVMELVPGGSVQDHLKAKGRYAWRDATSILADVCRGVIAAHAAGLIHRDIKPSNVFRSDDGVVKLGDFGLVKPATRHGTVVTMVGVVMGTPHYMSPEQSQSGRVDERSDVYSLGATYYALLTGKPPYPGNDSMQVLFAHNTKPIPDPRAAWDDVPEACAAIVRRAMAKKRVERYPDVQTLLADLERISTSNEAPSSDPFTWSNDQTTNSMSIADAYPAERTAAAIARRRIGWKTIATGLGVAAVLAIGSLAIFLGRGGPAVVPQNRGIVANDWPTLSAAADSAIRNRQAAEMTKALDGIRILQSRPAGDAERAAMAQTAARLEKAAAFRKSITEKGLVLGTTGLVSGVAFSLDGRILAAASSSGDGGVLVLDSWTGDKLTTLAPRRNNVAVKVQAIAISHDAKSLAAVCGDNVVKVYQIDTGAERILPLDKSVNRVPALAFSPVTRNLAAALDPTGDGIGRPYLKIWDVDAARDAFAVKAEHRGKNAAVAFSAAGQHVVSGGRDTRVIMWEAETGRIWRELHSKFQIQAIACSPRGGTLAVAGTNGVVPMLQIWDYAGDRLLESKPLLAPCTCLAYSPDGSRLAGGCGNDALIWDADTRAVVATLKGHSLDIASLVFAGRGGILATGSLDQTLRLWDVSRHLLGP